MRMTDSGYTEFAGTRRFSVEQRLGAGAFGVVYRVFDRKRNAVVALKTLQRSDPSWLYRFKQEFRSLLDISHPNLAQLYELLCEEDRWYFTMELVEGVNFLDYVRGNSAIPPDEDSATLTIARPEVNLPPQTSLDPGPTPHTVDFDRLRDAFRQLARGLSAIHDAGKLHRDVKPSNVLVDRAGRVVVLDFGLITESDPQAPQLEYAGTPRYMAPEQRVGRAVAASDWYAVGAMLYECLAGRPRVTTHEPRDVSWRPVPPSQWNPEVPDHLDRLCLDLLECEAGQRPSRARLLRAFGEESSTAPASSGGALFVGRKLQLAALRDAFEATQQGHAVVVRVMGSSGIGKTALVRQFLQSIGSEQPGAAILAGRCFDRESVPYKALDGVVDSLSQFLRSLGEQQAERCMPLDILALARIFPVLRRVPSVANVYRRIAENPDFQELRRKGFGALRELLSRQAAVGPVVVFIDDLQWGDLDSGPLIETLLREPDSPALLLIASYRSEEEASNPVLKALLAALQCAPDCRDLPVGELGHAEARELAGLLVPGSGAGSVGETVVKEAGGNPFLIDALLRNRAGSGGQLRRLELGEVLQQQISRVPETARTLLELLSVAGRPVPLDIATGMLSLAGDPATLNLLRSERLIRARSASEGEELETYHDRIRESVVALLPESRLQACHLLLAQTYAARSDSDAEAVAMHFHYAGDREQAARFAETAAAQAAEALAFDRAARLYRMALTPPSLAAARARALHTQLGHVLTYAGRGHEAAQAYANAAETATAAEKLDLLRRSAEQSLICGHFDEGIETLRKVLDTVGLRMARTPRAALWSFFWRRALLKIRGLRFHARPSETIAASELLRIDACMTAVAGMVIGDTVGALDFQSRHLLYALRAGDPWRIARALCVDVGVMGVAGARTARMVDRTAQTAKAMLARVNDPDLDHLHGYVVAWAALWRGSWTETIRLLRQNESRPLPQQQQWAWGVTISRLAHLFALIFSGELAELKARVPGMLRDARERGDLFTEVSIQNWAVPFTLLMNDEPERARREMREAIDRWSPKGFHCQHFWNLLAENEISSYLDQAAETWDRLERRWPDLAASQLFQIEVFRVAALYARARSALALAAAGGNRKRLLETALLDARRVEREKPAWCQPFCALVRAGAANLRGRPAEAADLLARAEQGFGDADMKLYQAVAHRCGGMLTGNPSQVGKGELFMTAQGIRNPAKFTRMLAPGFMEVECGGTVFFV
jgi:hypothetical protein